MKPSGHVWVLWLYHLVEYHKRTNQCTSHEVIGDGELLSNQVFIGLEVIFRVFAMLVQSNQTVITVHPDEWSATNEWKYATTDGEEEV